MGFRTCAAVIIAKVLNTAPEIVKYNIQQMTNYIERTEPLSVLEKLFE